MERPAPAPTEGFRPTERPQTDARRRVAIERISPEIDCGRFAIKRVVGESVVVEADIFTDGHDQLACRVLYWQGIEKGPHSSPLLPLVNDRWRGEFRVTKIGTYRYTVEGWTDRFKTWRDDLNKRIAAAQDVQIELLIGAELIGDAAKRVEGEDSELLREWANRLRDAVKKGSGKSIALEEELLPIMERCPDPKLTSRYGKELSGNGGSRRKRAFRHGTKFSRVLVRPSLGITARCRIARLGWPISRPWASTWFICRPFTRSGARIAKEKTISCGRTRRCGQSVGDWIGRGRSQVDSSAVGHAGRFPPVCLQGRKNRDWKLRWTSRSSARRTIPMYASIRSGSAGVRTARSNMRRILPRSTRTSIRSISKLPMRWHYGTN